MKKRIVAAIFRERVTEEVYLFDVLARGEEDYPKMVGRILVNVNTEEKIYNMNTAVSHLIDYEMLSSQAMDLAKNIQKLIGK